MLIYGNRKKYLNSKRATILTCPNCEVQGKIKISIFSKYLHLFWIPTIPIRKMGFSECSHCKNVLNHSEMPSKFKNEYSKLKESSSTPVWQFSGLLIIIALFTTAFLSRTNYSHEYISKPQVGDVYIMRQDSLYGAMKVINTSENEIKIRLYKYMVKNMHQFNFDDDKSFMKRIGHHTKGSIENQYKEGFIKQILRKEVDY